MGEDFVDIFKVRVTRPGTDKMLKWLVSSDFFTAPASTRFHLSRPGGLVEHSIHVYKRLREDYIHNSILCGESGTLTPEEEETIAIVGLLHDVCKANVYKEETRNQKTYDQEKVAKAQAWQVKHDAGGNFIWEAVRAYKFDEDVVLGHGEKSVMIIQNFMKLSREEIYAIRWHMGAWQDGEKQSAGNAYGKCKLAVMTHIADMEATYLDEA